MVSIRPATVDDQSAIHKIVRSAKINPRGLVWDRFLVATTVDGAVVGVAQIKLHDHGTRELASIAVTPSHMKMGIAALLIDALIEPETGDLFLYCERGLAHFYRRFGFVETADDRSVPTDLLGDVKFARMIMKIVRFIKRSETQLVVMRRLARPFPEPQVRRSLPAPSNEPEM